MCREALTLARAATLHRSFTLAESTPHRPHAVAFLSEVLFVFFFFMCIHFFTFDVGPQERIESVLFTSVLPVAVSCHAHFNIHETHRVTHGDTDKTHTENNACTCTKKLSMLNCLVLVLDEQEEEEGEEEVGSASMTSESEDDSEEASEEGTEDDVEEDSLEEEALGGRGGEEGTGDADAPEDVGAEAAEEEVALLARTLLQRALFPFCESSFILRFMALFPSAIAAPPESREGPRTLAPGAQTREGHFEGV